MKTQEESYLDEEIVYATTKNNSLDRVILKNPNRKELKENNLLNCRIVFDDYGNAYFGSAYEYIHATLADKVSEQGVDFELYGDSYNYGFNVWLYDYNTNTFWYRVDEVDDKINEIKQDLYNELKSIPYLIKNFGNFNVEVDSEELPYTFNDGDPYSKQLKLKESVQFDSEVIKNPSMHDWRKITHSNDDYRVVMNDKDMAVSKAFDDLHEYIANESDIKNFYKGFTYQGKLYLEEDESWIRDYMDIIIENAQKMYNLEPYKKYFNNGIYVSLTDVKNNNPIEMRTLNESVEFSLPNENSLGEPIADNEESLRNFWNWFGDSKVVDKQGRPLVVYHGTSKTFEKFYQYAAEGWGEGSYFTDNLEDAFEYGEKIYKVYLRISNPYTGDIDQIMDTPTVKCYDDFDIVNESGYLMGKAIREAGFDGIIVKDSNNINGLEIVAFNSNQIKSITNKGSWSKESNNIYESEEYAMPMVYPNPSYKEFHNLLRNYTTYGKLSAIIDGNDIYCWDSGLAHHGSMIEYIESKLGITISDNALWVRFKEPNIVWVSAQYFDDYSDDELEELDVQDFEKEIERNPVIKRYFPNGIKITRFNQLNESIKTIENNVKIINTNGEMIQWLNNNHNCRIIYDNKNKWYIVSNDLINDIHILMIEDAIVSGLYPEYVAKYNKIVSKSGMGDCGLEILTDDSERFKCCICYDKDKQYLMTDVHKNVYDCGDIAVYDVGDDFKQMPIYDSVCGKNQLNERLYPEIPYDKYDYLLSLTSPNDKANAYTKWFGKQYLDGNITLNDEIETMCRNHKILKDAGQVQSIMDYETIDELKTDLSKGYQTNNAKNKEASKGAVLVGNIDGWKIYDIRTWAAAKKYGYGTRWCVTDSESDHYFRKYVHDRPEDNARSSMWYLIKGNEKYAIVFSYCIYPRWILCEINLFDDSDDNIATYSLLSQDGGKTYDKEDTFKEGIFNQVKKFIIDRYGLDEERIKEKIQSM